MEPSPVDPSQGKGARSDPSWAARWQSLLLPEGAEGSRERAQGRAYHRSGRVTDVRVTSGGVSGRVQGKRATPRAVEATVAVLDADQWRRVVDLLAGQLRHSTRLLAGLQPEGLDEELAAVGVRLLPEPDDVTTACGCSRPQPCAHVYAVWEAVTERIDDDPFVLLRLRGRGRERLLADLAADRSDAGESSASVALDELDAGTWTRARAPLEEVPLPAGDDAPSRPLRLLGNPPGWPGGPDAESLFGPLVERAARWAADVDRG